MRDIHATNIRDDAAQSASTVASGVLNFTASTVAGIILLCIAGCIVTASTVADIILLCIAGCIVGVLMAPGVLPVVLGLDGYIAHQEYNKKKPVR